ncbi:MAG: N,N-dimethylformamidase [Proteobacteria bacterium]|nr:N,N-dimethylformamidase [Pseudomonadota bacterium]
MEHDFVKSLVSYLDPLSVQPGKNLSIRVSCEAPGEFQAQLVRLICADNRPHGTGFVEQELDASLNGRYPARYQGLHPGSYALLPALDAMTDVTVVLGVYPTTPTAQGQCMVGHPDLSLRIENGVVVAWTRNGTLRSEQPLQARRWHIVVYSHNATGQCDLTVVRLGLGVGEHDVQNTVSGDLSTCALSAGDWLLAAQPVEGRIQAGFNGRLEAPGILARALSADAALTLHRNRSVTTHADVQGAWDFSLEIGSDTVVDTSPHKRHGSLHQQPLRAVKGMLWRGDIQAWQHAPEQYAAIHFHEDDLVDAGWEADIVWQLPDDLASGVYAVRLRQESSEDYAPFFVRPGDHQTRANLALLIPTATYLAYANQRLGLTDGPFGSSRVKNSNDAYLLQHPEVGYSLYEYHEDNSGVHFSSYHRPVLNMKPKGTPWAFTADMNLVAWLHAIDQPFDVITDEDLHREGEDLLRTYRTVITGTHPEYYSTAMLDALSQWLGQGGRLMYMGGNGFYWRIAYHPHDSGIIEVRRAEDGTRAWIAENGEYYHAFTGEYGGLWRRLGRPPNQLVGIGFAAQGFDGGTYYRLQPGARDPRVQFILRDVSEADILGNHGTQGGGAAGEEIDRFDESIGSPAHALVIASSENHRPGMLRVKEEFHMTQALGNDPQVRGDMTFFETPSGGAVFSTGSISYAGALSTGGYRNDIARLTGNVLRRFLDATPFVYPDS